MRARGWVTLAGCAALAGCASRSVPRAAPASASEPAALAVADAMIEAAGGAAAWREVRELGWLQGLVVDGMLVDAQELVWDRDGGRLRHVWVDTSGAVTIVLRPLDAGGHVERVSWSGRRTEFAADERARVLAHSRSTWEREGFLFALPFSLRWPDVTLTWAGERTRPTVRRRGDGPARYDVLRVTRPGRPEALFVVAARDTRRPVLVEIDDPRRPGREGWLLRGWQRAGGITLATRREALPRAPDAPAMPFVMPVKWRGRIALSPFEVPARGVLVVIAAASARAEVDERLFVPQVEP